MQLSQLSAGFLQVSCDALMRVYGSDPQSLKRFLLHDETAMSFGLTLVVCETMHGQGLIWVWEFMTQLLWYLYQLPLYIPLKKFNLKPLTVQLTTMLATMPKRITLYKPSHPYSVPAVDPKNASCHNCRDECSLSVVWLHHLYKKSRTWERFVFLEGRNSVCATQRGLMGSG